MSLIFSYFYWFAKTLQRFRDLKDEVKAFLATGDDQMYEQMNDAA